MTGLEKKLREILERFRFEMVTTELKQMVERELLSFVEEKYPKIEKEDKYKYMRIEYQGSELNLVLSDEFASKMLERYPEEFI